MSTRFRDRREAGRRLARALSAYAVVRDLLVLGLPRGGVPVAYEVARALGAPLDVFVVRKLGVPGFEELAMGAIASGGIRLVDPAVVHELGIRESDVERVTAAEWRELVRREREYRGDRPPPGVAGRTVVLVDDGLATGASMRVAAAALRERGPRRLVVAVPVAAPEVCEMLQRDADDVVCAVTPEPFVAVSRWYEDFGPTSDEEVRALLAGTPMDRADGPQRTLEA